MRTREEILEDIEDCTKWAEFFTKSAEIDAEDAEECTNWAEIYTKWVEEYRQELKEYDEANK